MRPSRRRQFLIALGTILLVPHAGAQSIPHVGLLFLESSFGEEGMAAINERLRQDGLVEGKDFLFERVSAVTAYQQLPNAAAELVRRKVSVIFSYGDTATHAAAKATSTIPIVMLIGTDPVSAGLATSLARPGGNVTGISTMVQFLIAKRLELLKESVPTIKHVAVLFNPGSRNEAESVKQVEIAARAIGLRVYAAEARESNDIEPAILAAKRAGADALMTVPSTFLQGKKTVERISELAIAHRLPLVSNNAVDGGGMISYQPSRRFLFHGVGGYLARILKGAKPAELPIEQPTIVELAVNLKTARALGIKIPQSILLRADRVIE